MKTDISGWSQVACDDLKKTGTSEPCIPGRTDDTGVHREMSGKLMENFLT